MTLLRSGAASDVGRRRSVNQDAILTTPTLFVVADGMGGHAAGDIAATMAVRTFEAAGGRLGTEASFSDAISTANAEIYQASIDDPALAGMGTTLVAACLLGGASGDRLVVMNVGDSRAYRFRSGALSQITDDHSMVAEMVRRGELRPEEAEVHQQRHVITRALGLEPEVAADTFGVALREGDRIVLCSDGLTDEVDDEEIALALSTVADPQAAADDLVARANAHGGADNISVVIIDVLMADEAPEEATQAHRVVSAAVAGGATTAAGAPAAATSASDDEGWIARRRRLGIPRTVTFRVLVFIVLVAAVGWGAWAFVRWYAMSSYFVQSTDGQSIVIYQGRPGGVLWFQPQVTTVSTTTTGDVLPSRVKKLEHGVVEPSLAAAEHYIANLADEKRSTTAVQPSTTPTATVPSTQPGASGSGGTFGGTATTRGATVTTSPSAPTATTAG